MNLDHLLNMVLVSIRNAYYLQNPHLFAQHFSGVRIAGLEDHKLVLLAPGGNEDLLNANFGRVMLKGMQAGGLDVSEVVFGGAPNFQPEATLEEEPGEELALDGTDGGEYETMVRPERIIAVPRYFLRHISRMGAENAWLYMGFRQAAYQAGLQHGVQQISIAAPRICRWAGMHRSTFWRKVANPETWQGLKGFVRPGVAGSWTQENEDGKPRREPNHYTVSMTIPLIPAHVLSLRSFLMAEARLHGIEAALANALELPAGQILCDDPGQAEGDPQTVYQVVTALGGSSRAASALQAHLMPEDDVLIVPQYFVERWLPKIKPGASWMILWMRSGCGPHHEFTASLQEIMQLTGMTREKTIREWLLDEVVRLFVHEDPKVKARGRAAPRRFIVRENQPLASEWAHDKAQVATRREEPGSLPAWAEKQMGVLATGGGEASGVNATIGNAPLGALATIRKAKSPSRRARLRCSLGAVAPVKGLINQNLIHLDHKISTRLTQHSGENGNARRPTKPPCPGEPDKGLHQPTQPGVVEVGTAQIPQEISVCQKGREDAGMDNDRDEGGRTEPVDPGQFFQQILKRAEVAPKIRRRLQGKPFYPFLCWLIYGASREKIDDPLAFAISRYDQGLPDSLEIRQLASDLEALLAELDYFERFWSLPPALKSVFGNNSDRRVRRLAQLVVR